MVVADQIKLFRVISTAQSQYLSGHSHAFTIYWYVHSRLKSPMAYLNAIENYKPNHPFAPFAENIVEECFTKDEADDFIDYLIGFKGFITEAIEVQLPIQLRRQLGFTDIPHLEGCVRYHLFKHSDYKLSFRVSGYCDARYVLKNGLSLEKLLLYPRR